MTLSISNSLTVSISFLLFIGSSYPKNTNAEGIPRNSEKYGLQCTEDGECISTGEYLFCDLENNSTCHCSVPKPNEVKTCLKWKEEGQKCIKDSECNRSLRLSCVQGICGCNPETSIRNEEEYWTTPTRVVAVGECLSKLRMECGKAFDPYGPICARPAQCVTQNNTRETGLCECHEPLKETKTGKCGLYYRQRCGAWAVCQDAFRCVSSSLSDLPTCECPHVEYQEFSWNADACQSHLDFPCDPDDGNSCFSPAKCTDTPAGPRCKCVNGTTPNAEGRYEIQYGFPCDYTVNDAALCNQAAKLVCKTGNPKDGADVLEFKCRCPNEADIFEPEKNRCSRPVQVQCKAKDEKDDGDCITNSECKGQPGSAWSVCTCRAGGEMGLNEPTKDGHCKRAS